MLKLVGRAQRLFRRLWSRSADDAGRSGASERPLDTADAFASARSRDVNPAEWGNEGGAFAEGYLGWRAGVRPDGRWVFFVAGD